MTSFSKGDLEEVLKPKAGNINVLLVLAGALGPVVVVLEFDAGVIVDHTTTTSLLDGGVVDVGGDRARPALPDVVCFIAKTGIRRSSEHGSITEAGRHVRSPSMSRNEMCPMQNQSEAYRWTKTSRGDARHDIAGSGRAGHTTCISLSHHDRLKHQNDKGTPGAPTNLERRQTNDVSKLSDKEARCAPRDTAVVGARCRARYQPHFRPDKAAGNFQQGG